MENIFVIVDENNLVAGIRTNLFGRDVTVSAIFHEEQDALEFLWACQDQLEKPHKVMRIPKVLVSE